MLSDGARTRAPEAHTVDDKEILAHIERLVNEEHALMQRHEAGTVERGDRDRMRELQIALDRAWDLLRQRRGMRDRGEDPDDASERPARVVEDYRQ